MIARFRITQFVLDGLQQEGYVMKLLRTAIVPAAVVIGLAGCSGQDKGQPPMNSISAGPKSDAPLVRVKKGTSPVAPARKP